MHNITIVSLGPGSRDLLTLGTLDALRLSSRVILRTGLCDAARFLSDSHISYDTLDLLHEQCEDFDELISSAAQAVLDAAENSDVCYAVLDASEDETVTELLKRQSCTVLPGVPISAPFTAAYPSSGLLTMSASALRICGTQHDLLITELDSRMLAGNCKLEMLNWYDASDELLFFDPSSSVCRSFRRIPLEDLDRQPKYDHTCAVLIPSVPLEKRRRFDFYDLVRIMALLRAPGGCPWDREQTHTSLRPYLIEESYETAEALDREDWQDAADELGDVLLQVVFHAAIGREDGSMELSDITTDICRKLIHRHAHVFGKDVCETAEAVTENWNRIKQEDRGEKTKGDSLRSIPVGMEPLLRAAKARKKASEAGFTEESLSMLAERFSEKCSSLQKAADKGREESLRMLLGDMLFDLVEMCRCAGEDSEKLLALSTERFIDRFCRMEKAIIDDGKDMKSLTMPELVVYWKSCGQHDRARNIE